MVTPFELENRLWSLTQAGDIDDVINLFSTDSKIFIDGENVEKESFCKQFAVGCKDFTIDELNVKYSGEDSFEDSYSSIVHVKDGLEDRFDGCYRLLTKWKGKDNNFKIMEINIEKCA